MVLRCVVSGRDMTRRVRETICISFDPVVVEMFYDHSIAGQPRGQITRRYAILEA